MTPPSRQSLHPPVAETDFNGGGPEGLLDLIFLRFAEVRSAAQRAKLKAE